jgi:hypothetical protein
MKVREITENLADTQVNITSIPHDEPLKLKAFTYTSPGGKEYTFDTEDQAKQHFGKTWAHVNKTWKVEHNSADKA